MKRLNLDNNEITSLPSEIGQLTNLEQLNLDHNRLTVFPEGISNLTNLIELTMSENELASIAIDIKNLKNLKTLYLTDNKIHHLPSQIGELASLEFLALMNNLIPELPSEVGSLTNLRILDLTGNRYLTFLPIELKKLKNLTDIFIEGTSIQIPPEIAAQTSKPQIILNYYFPRSQKHLNEVKVLVVGQGSVGKTSLVQRILNGIFDQKSNQNRGNIH